MAKGVALIPALLVMSIVASVAAMLGLGQQIWIRQTENVRDQAQAEEWARSGVADAASILTTVRFARATPETLEALSREISRDDDSDTENVNVDIRSAQALVNLNGLIRGGKPSADELKIFQRLLTRLKENPELIDAVLDWIDPDSERRPSGAEDAEYLSQANPYRAANRPFETVEELSQVRGFEPIVLDKLRPFLTALPEATDLDVNSAPAEILLSLFENPPVDLDRRLIQQRQRFPFQNAFDFGARAGAPLGISTGYETKTRYFLVRSKATSGRSTVKTESLIYCPQTFEEPRVLWRTDVF